MFRQLLSNEITQTFLFLQNLSNTEDPDCQGGTPIPVKLYNYFQKYFILPRVSHYKPTFLLIFSY